VELILTAQALHINKREWSNPYTKNEEYIEIIIFIYIAM